MNSESNARTFAAIMATSVAAVITGTVDTKVAAGASVTKGQVLAVQISSKVRDSDH